MTSEHPGLGLLVHEFGDEWHIAVRPGGLDIWTAWRKDGSAEHFIATRTAGELLGKLRALRDRDYGNGLPLDEAP